MKECVVLLLFIFSSLIVSDHGANLNSNSQIETASVSSSANINKSSYRESSYGCLCSNYSCGCCSHLEVPRIGLNDTGCVNLTYLPNEYGISFTMTLDNLTIYNETISAKNPPPICFGAPILKEYADLCLHFYDLNASRNKLHGCVKVEARMHHVVIGQYKIGCFNIGQSRWNLYHKNLIYQIKQRTVKS